MLDWYDIQYENSYDSENNIEIERIYCFDWRSFTENDRKKLKDIYLSLPGNVSFPERQNYIPYWFGHSDDKAPFLSASEESPGLHVYGILSVEQLECWHHDFITKIAGLPMREF